MEPDYADGKYGYRTFQPMILGKWLDSYSPGFLTSEIGILSGTVLKIYLVDSMK